MFRLAQERCHKPKLRFSTWGVDFPSLYQHLPPLSPNPTLHVRERIHSLTQQMFIEITVSQTPAPTRGATG